MLKAEVVVPVLAKVVEVLAVVIMVPEVATVEMVLPLQGVMLEEAVAELADIPVLEVMAVQVVTPLTVPEAEEVVELL